MTTKTPDLLIKRKAWWYFLWDSLCEVFKCEYAALRKKLVLDADADIMGLFTNGDLRITPVYRGERRS